MEPRNASERLIRQLTEQLLAEIEWTHRELVAAGRMSEAQLIDHLRAERERLSLMSPVQLMGLWESGPALTRRFSAK